MGQWLTWGVIAYGVLAVLGAWWSHRHGAHRSDASPVARATAAVVVGLAWPWLAVDILLLDPDDTRGRRRRRSAATAADGPGQQEPR